MPMNQSNTERMMLPECVWSGNAQVDPTVPRECAGFACREKAQPIVASPPRIGWLIAPRAAEREAFERHDAPICSDHIEIGHLDFGEAAAMGPGIDREGREAVRLRGVADGRPRRQFLHVYRRALSSACGAVASIYRAAASEYDG